MTLKLFFGLVLVLIVGTGLYHSLKPLPTGIAYEGSMHPLIEPRLLTDRTLHFGNEAPRLNHEIFDHALKMIGSAHQFILVDMFLYNSTGGSGEDRKRPNGDTHLKSRPLADQLTDALIRQKEAFPALQAMVITDPLNTLYGGVESEHFQRLESAGIPVIETRLTPLRDSNPTWSALWRLCCQWFGNSAQSGWLPNPIGDEPVTLRSYLSLLNFKANHRKVLIADQQNHFRALVSSANPHDGSSQHSNIGLSFQGPAVADLLRSERAVLVMSGAPTQAVDNALGEISETAEASDARIQILTESAIRDATLEMVTMAESGDQLDLAMFYLSHRGILTSLIKASRRGVHVRVLLDANHDAFGREKSGVPNRQAAMELHNNGVDVRWCNTRGEQCHSKLLLRQDRDGQASMLLGSANFTRRNLDDLNLETDVQVLAYRSHPTIAKADLFFEEQWNNGPGNPAVMSLPYKAWADHSRVRYWQYRFMEATGLSTF
ncbi:phospholipase D family protein [Marinobacter sp. CHS3-4]|uniref:phospholipase D family protein n=1 Tax=Marinobacter sp. CHS3-4 TaxID=3045174 RepID=UPI0024B5BDC8|nr:phospholipase D family protein [Marinobacter sp. CHS3-4]MDI9246046.1 phospholipase D family protein [Marinobacter sp. CHS3-4]